MAITPQTSAWLTRDPEGAARSLVDLWRGKVVDGRIPWRTDFALEELRPWLGHLAIYEVERTAPGGRPRYRFRLSGTMIVEYDGGDFTGRHLDEAIPAAWHDTFIPSYDEVARTGEPKLESVEAPNAHGLIVRFTKALLPLGADGRTVDQIILFMVAVYLSDPRVPTYSAEARA